MEVYPEAKKVGQQLQYAEKRGFRVALIAGPDEFANQVWKVKDLARREEKTVPAAEVPAAIRTAAGTRPWRRTQAMDRSNHYEAAFEAYLQWHRLCYVAVDETRRAQLGDLRVKSLDFIVYGEGGARLLVDVKGRRFPTGAPGHQRRVWECWSTQDDVDGLECWAELFGPGYCGLLVFAYQLAAECPTARRHRRPVDLARPALPAAGGLCRGLSPLHARPQSQVGHGDAAAGHFPAAGPAVPSFHPGRRPCRRIVLSEP